MFEDLPWSATPDNARIFIGMSEAIPSCKFRDNITAVFISFLQLFW